MLPMTVDVDVLPDLEEKNASLLVRTKEKRRTLVTFFLVVSVLFLVGILVVVFMMGRIIEFALRSASEGTDAPTQSPAPTLSQEAEWRDLIQDRSPPTSASLDDVGSPQQQAFDWLLNDAYTKTLDSKDRVLQRFALVTFSYATGEGKSPWFRAKTECEWEQGLACNTENVIQRIYWSEDIVQNSRLPDEFSLLTSLKELDLSSNALEGSIRSIHMSEMTYLRLAGTQITGTIASMNCANEGGNLTSAVVDCVNINCACCKCHEQENQV